MVHRTAVWVALTLLALTQAQVGVAAQKALDAPSSLTVLVLPLDNSSCNPRHKPCSKLREEVRQLLSALDAKNEAGDRP